MKTQELELCVIVSLIARDCLYRDTRSCSAVKVITAAMTQKHRKQKPAETFRFGVKQFVVDAPLCGQVQAFFCLRSRNSRGGSKLFTISEDAKLSE